MNLCVEYGRITKDLTVRYVGQDNKAVCKFVLAVPRYDKDKADFISCVAWGKTAETMGKYLKKGSKILAKGRIETDVYEKDGQKIYTTEFVVENFDFGDSKKEDKAEEPKDEFVSIPEGEELPFVF